MPTSPVLRPYAQKLFEGRVTAEDSRSPATDLLAASDPSPSASDLSVTKLFVTTELAEAMATTTPATPRAIPTIAHVSRLSTSFVRLPMSASWRPAMSVAPTAAKLTKSHLADSRMRSAA
jgi:hypothetical protein